MVYQIEEGCTRLLWVAGNAPFRASSMLFITIGEPLSEGIRCVRSQTRRPYLKVIKEHCPNAINIVVRFHIAAKMNDVLDDLRAAEAG